MAIKNKLNEELATLAEETPVEDTPTVDQSTQSTQEILPKGIVKAEITQEMQKSYLDYAMSVIVSRALPDVRDGLKPVHRRIIYAMYDQGMSHTSKFHKCAAVVGEVLKKYHPHGDIAVYDSLVRMGQDFSLRYPLIAPQGNFGSVDGDPPAAMRYTECKLAQIAEQLYTDIDKDTVDFALNDLQNYEPVILPSLLPNILLNGSSGIAVGMATNIPPHNIGEVLAGLLYMIDNPDAIGTENKETKIADTAFSSNATTEDLVKIIKGPDFPTGGIIYGQKELTQVYATGRGRVVTRAKTEIEEDKGGKTKIIVTEIPYQVNKATLVEKIADLVRDKKIVGIYDLRDESNREGMRIMIELKRDAIPQKVLNQLFKYTALQSTFNANMVALLDGEPKLMTLKSILEEFVIHRQKVVVKRTIYLLKKAKEREHILLGLKIALDHLDEVIKLIRASKDAETAKTGLMEKFELSEIQSQAILDLQLRKLAALERKKIEDELEEIVRTIKNYEAFLYSPQRILTKVREEITQLAEKYTDPRKTKIIKSAVGELNDEDLVTEEQCIVTISQSGYIKRMKKDTYRKQGRGGRGVSGQSLKEDDVVTTIRTCNTHDYALLFTSKGKVYKMRVWEIPEVQRTTRGTSLANFLSVAQGETVEAFLTIDEESLAKSQGYIVFATTRGIIKKTAVTEFSNIRTNGIMAVNLGSDDTLLRVNFSSGADDVLLVTTKGQSIRFKESDVRSMGRQASGVTGVRLGKKDDQVVGMEVLNKDSKQYDLLVLTEKGYGKKTSISEYKIQNRAGSGVLTYKVTERVGKVSVARIIEKKPHYDMLISTKNGIIIRVDANKIPTLGRATQGVRVIKLDESDSVSSIAFLNENDKQENGNEKE
ncbi:DNA gyrase subunit A [candidate division WWE3 bacterium CG08_land_8_20_14_0_20_41_10]|uniref:DNA gyrase subunit A n=1 Tax=candidate division WWE3 bacterium CG08_land_8_20_14_0_20_41_10 TaxID=1975085 RepID=A0A2H0XBE1_UNCKA|nr:MAG: DNA gyrase subunit A [candidate division WWE3 bacterium CG08_land_8_20_14_0_20_41_10]